MFNNTYKALLILSFHVLFLIHLSAQVTIGSTETPVDGAILELKEEGTTTKGLGLPRVELTSLTIKDNSNNVATTVKGATDIWDPTAHIGLVVYHAGVYDVCDPYSIPQGLYAWTGDQWQAQFWLPEDAPEVKIYRDTRDNQVADYRYRKFGNAGEWMLENMRYIPPGMQAGLMGNDPTDKYYTYPNPVQDSPETIPSTWRPNQGLLYTYSAGTLGEQDDVTTEDQGQESEDAGYIHPVIQGICPPGWHIPSDREWNQLEKEIYSSPNKYSEYKLINGLHPFNPTAWDPTWDTTNNPRGALYDAGHGLAMLSTCAPINSKRPIVYGKSLTAQQGGFDVLLTGTVIQDEFEMEYGFASHFWTSSVSGDEVWIRSLFSDVNIGEVYPSVVRGTIPERAIPLSVRCKKNE